MEPISLPLLDATERKWRHPRDLTVKEKIFVVLALITIIDEFVLSIVKIATDNSWSSDVIISIAVLINVVLCTVYSVEGVFTTRPSQLLIFATSLLFLTALLFGNYITGHHSGVKLAQMIVAVVGTVALLAPSLYFAWKYDQDNRLVRLTVGESDTHQIIYKYLLTFRDLLLLQFQTGSCVVVLEALLFRKSADFVMMILGFPYLVVWAMFGHYTVKHEHIRRTYLFFLSSPLGLALIIYGIVFVGNNIDTYPGIAFGIILSSIAYFVALVCVLVCAVVLYRKFATGVADRIN